MRIRRAGIFVRSKWFWLVWLACLIFIGSVVTTRVPRLRRSALTSADLWLRQIFRPETVSTVDPPDPYRGAGASALALAEEIASLGPRPPASPAHQAMVRLLEQQLVDAGCSDIEHVSFVASTPRGPVSMNNLVVRLHSNEVPEKPQKIVVVSGHYDTLPMREFAGANDGASSAAALVEMCRLLATDDFPFQVWLVFFDGEEAVVDWRGDDHTYGSRHLANLWESDGTLQRVLALINIDMVGDADLGFVFEKASTPWLRAKVWSVAQRQGYRREFRELNEGYVADDHSEFLRKGVSSVNLIDFDYGWMNRHWHTRRDDVSRLSARSFGVTLHVLVETLRSLSSREAKARRSPCGSERCLTVARSSIPTSHNACGSAYCIYRVDAF